MSTVAVRAAVTTGEAVVSLGARPERGEGIVAGDVVNIAARLQSAAPVGSVVVDASTMRSTADAIDFEPLEPVAAKGKAGADPGLAGSGSTEPIRRRHRATMRETLFVGRESELATPGETFARVRSTSRRHSSSRSSGEPGSARAASSGSFARRVDHRPELVRWRQGRCLPYGEGITFWALGEIVKAEAGILETDSPARGRS